MWASAQPAVSSGVVPLEPLSARPQQQPVGKPVPPPVLSPAPPTPAQTASSISGAGTSQPSSSREHLLEEPARHIPSKFLVLVQELEAMKKEGSPEPLWSAVCLRVYKRLPSVLAKAGVTKWKAYMLLAQKEGIVDLKIPRPGDETVSLKI
ncbi:hypothetical protein FRC01_013554 [Tulasnella sp. 417]|nr:hypothetical protein FRC01_013554 [Tulasnella sp. 417]